MAEQIALNCHKHDVKLIVTWVSCENQLLQIPGASLSIKIILV